MDRIDPNKRPERQSGENDSASCPKCATVPRVFTDILDSRNGKVFRLFLCECGEVFWKTWARLSAAVKVRFVLRKQKYTYP